jgi:hypothetical protein
MQRWRFIAQDVADFNLAYKIAEDGRGRTIELTGQICRWYVLSLYVLNCPAWQACESKPSWSPAPGCNRAQDDARGNVLSWHTLVRDASPSMFRAYPLS